MSILAVHRTPTLTRERYDDVVLRLTGGKPRIESPSDLPFKGLLAHATGQSRDGFVVVDIFESERAVEAFAAALGSIPRDVGIAEPPEFMPAHTVFIAPPR